MTKSMLEKIKDPNSRWIVYLYVIPHYPHEMYYVGVSSNDIDIRLSNGYGNNKELRKAIRDAGGMKNVKIYIISRDVDASTAAALEREYIAKYHSLYDPDAPRGGYGYNKQDGGFFGFQYCQYSKDLISKSKSVPVAQISRCEDKIIAIYASQKIANEVTGISWRNITKNINNPDRNHTAGNYRWISLKPYLTKEQIEKIFYSNDASDVIIPLDPNILYADIKTKPKAKKNRQAAGAIPAAVHFDEERII